MQLDEPNERSDPKPLALDDLEFSDPIEPKARVPRDGWDRPYVVPPEGGKRRAYARCTTFVGCLEDQYTVHLWQQRMTAIGLADRPDLLLSVAANRDDREELNKIVERAREAAKANTGATTGTALHLLTEQVDRGEDPRIPPDYRKDIEQYKIKTEPFEMVSMEQFCVLDKYKVAGTPDRVIRFNDRYYIGDVKTGTIDFGQLKFAMQFAVYSRSKPYDFRRAPAHNVEIAREEALSLRGEWPGEIEQDRAILIHLPQGEGRCVIHWVDIAAGWDAVQIAAAVRAWRNRKGLIQPFDLAAEAAIARIRDAETVTDLERLYRDYVADGGNGDLIVEHCKARKWHIIGRERDREGVAQLKRNGRLRG